MPRANIVINVQEINQKPAVTMIKKIQPILKKFYPVQSFSLDVEIDNRFSTLDSELKQQLSQTHLQLEDYYNVLNYFIEGIDAYKLAEKSGVLYPGVAGTRGVGVEAFEGFARTAPTGGRAGRSR